MDDDDELALPKRKRDEEEMDITPMIDITFLLLIFFVVCSKMDPTQTGMIPDADNGVAVSAKDSAVIFIEPAGEDKVEGARNSMARNLAPTKRLSLRRSSNTSAKNLKRQSAETRTKS